MNGSFRSFRASPKPRFVLRNVICGWAGPEDEIGLVKRDEPVSKFGSELRVQQRDGMAGLNCAKITADRRNRVSREAE
jgi:hypothetical protein